MLLHQITSMPRQNITFTIPNDDWLKSQVSSQEYLSKSELINDLVRLKLDRAEKSGFTKGRKKEIIKASKDRMNA